MCCKAMAVNHLCMQSRIWHAFCIDSRTASAPGGVGKGHAGSARRCIGDGRRFRGCMQTAVEGRGTPGADAPMEKGKGLSAFRFFPRPRPSEGRGCRRSRMR